MADQPEPPLSPEQAREEAETREMLERAERAWQRQVEREEAGRAAPGQMTAFRWILVAIAAASLLLLLARRLAGSG